MESLKRKEFKEIFNNSTRSSYGAYVMFRRPGTGRIGIAISRNIGCHAYKNRVRRTVRVALSQLRSAFPFSYDYVILVRSWETEHKVQDVVSGIHYLLNLTFSHTYHLERERCVVK